MNKLKIYKLKKRKYNNKYNNKIFKFIFIKKNIL